MHKNAKPKSAADMTVAEFKQCLKEGHERVMNWDTKPMSRSSFICSRNAQGMGQLYPPPSPTLRASMQRGKRRWK